MVPENIIIWIALVAVGVAAGFVARIILQSTSDRRRLREANSAVETAERQAASLLKEAEIRAKELLLESRTRLEEETREEKDSEEEETKICSVAV